MQLLRARWQPARVRPQGLLGALLRGLRSRDQGGLRQGEGRGADRRPALADMPLVLGEDRAVPGEYVYSCKCVSDARYIGIPRA